MLKWATALSRKNSATAGPIGRSHMERWAATRCFVASSKRRYVLTTGDVTTGLRANEMARMVVAVVDTGSSTDCGGRQLSDQRYRSFPGCPARPSFASSGDSCSRSWADLGDPGARFLAGGAQPVARSEGAAPSRAA